MLSRSTYPWSPREFPQLAQRSADGAYRQQVSGEFGELEELGYLMQPHCSSGITEQGLRLYIDRFTQPRLHPGDRRSINGVETGLNTDFTRRAACKPSQGCRLRLGASDPGTAVQRNRNRSVCGAPICLLFRLSPQPRATKVGGTESRPGAETVQL